MPLVALIKASPHTHTHTHVRFIAPFGKESAEWAWQHTATFDTILQATVAAAVNVAAAAAAAQNFYCILLFAYLNC